MHFHKQHQALPGIVCGRSLIGSLLDPNMSTMDTNTNFSFIMGDANLNQAGDMRTSLCMLPCSPYCREWALFPWGFLHCYVCVKTGCFADKTRSKS